MILKSIELGYTAGTSDKVYHLRLEQEGVEYAVNALWGRRGSLLRVTPKYSGRDGDVARAMWDRVRNEKLSEGYVVERDDAAPGPSAAVAVEGHHRVAARAMPAAHAKAELEENDTRMLIEGRVLPWLPSDVEPSQLEQLIVDPAWMLQEKVDGIHLILDVRNHVVTATNKKGMPYAIPEVLGRHVITTMPDGLWDGEWLARPQQFVVFDLLRGPAGDLRGEPCEERWRSLTNLLIKAPACLGPRVSIVSSPGRLEKHKRGFLAELHRQAAEGAIFKRALAPYRPGAAGDMLRLKFRKRADVILQLRTGDTKASAEMFVMHEGKPFHVGTVAARTFFRRLQVGSVHVAEVEYLSASDSYALAQVVILRLRTDKAPEQCTRDQIVIGKRYRTAGGQ